MSNDSSESQPKTLGHPLSVILVTVGIFLVSQIVATIIVLIGLGIVHQGQSAEAISNLLNDSNAAQFFLILIAEALAAASVIFLVRRRHLSLSKIGLGRRPSGGDLWRGLVGFGLFWLLLIALSIALSFIPGIDTNQKQDLGFTALSSSSDKILAFLALVILPPLGEEPLVRGYLYSGLRERWKFVPAMVTTSIVFGIAHLELGSGNPLVWGAALNTFVLSLVLVYLRERTGALYAGMLTHMLNNVIAFIVYLH